MGVQLRTRTKKSFYNRVITIMILECKHLGCFFAISHGKFSCGDIGGSVKRFTAMESLRCLLDNQILNIEAMIFPFFIFVLR